MAAARAHQLDSLRLEGDVTNSLLLHLTRALRRYPTITRRFRPELACGIRSLLFFFTVLKGRPTPAQECMNLRYRGPLTVYQKAVLYAFTVVFPYAYNINNHNGNEQFKAVYLLGRALNSLLFVHTAAYRSLAERAAGAQLTYSVGDASNIPLDLLNRSYIWHGLASTAVAISPIVHSLGRHTSLPLIPFFNNNRNATLPKPNCPICRLDRLCMPHVARPCGCHFCYTCVASEKQGRPNTLRCARCNVGIASFERLTAS